MTIRIPIKALFTDNNADKIGEFENLDTLSSFVFSNDPTGKIYTTGTNISATFDNIDNEMTIIGDIVNPLKSCFHAYRNTAIYWDFSVNVGDQITKKIVYDIQLFDSTSSYDTSTGRFTAPVAGYYSFFAMHSISDRSNGWDSKHEKSWLSVNGVQTSILYEVRIPFSETYHVPGGWELPSVAKYNGNTIIHLNQNDYVEVYVQIINYDNNIVYVKNSLTGRENISFSGYMVSKD